MSQTDRIGDYRDISKWSYNLGEPDVTKHVQVPKGWTMEKSDFIQESEFGAAIFKNEATKEMVVVFRGTDPGKLRDQVTNLETFAKGHKPREYEMAERYMESALAGMPPGYQMRVTGHSQGAGMAHYMALKHDVPSVGFNTSPGNIYLNNIYETLPQTGNASHLEFRSSVDGTKGIPVLNSDFVSSAENPITNPGGMLLAPVAPGFVLDTQAYMDPIAKIQPVYLKTGCKDGICHSLENFNDPQLVEARQVHGGDILPDTIINGGEDKFMACFPTRDVTEGVGLDDAYWNEFKAETGKAADWAGEQVDNAVDAAKGAAAWTATQAGEAWDATTDAASAAWDATKETASDAWDATKDTASDAWDATRDTVSDVSQWTKEKAGRMLDWARDQWNSAPDEGATMTLPTVEVDASALNAFSRPGGSTSETIMALDDQAEQLADEADGHADRAETAARHARSSARRAAAAAARMRAMLSR